LLKQGYEVTALVQYNSFNTWGWLDDVENKDEINIISGDIRDPFFCETLTVGMDYIFHLAALIAIPYSYSAPDSYIETNVKGTLNICQGALKNKVEKTLITSTSEVYGTACYVPIDEKHPLQAQSPYSASKIAADAVAMSFFNSYDLPLTIVRPFNTYGPRQSARAVIPNIICQIASGIDIIELGETSPTRDFNYVEDTCRGFLEILKSAKTTGETINIGSNSEISIIDTLNKIKKLMKSNVNFVSVEERVRPKKSEVHRLWCDNKKINDLTGFKPNVNLDEGLQYTIDWLSIPENLSKYKAEIYNV
jgi:NAD dependent epimerase/dehydratase